MGHQRPITLPLRDQAIVVLGQDGIFRAPLPDISRGMKANADFFSHPVWAARYFDVENHSGLIAERWRSAIGDWSDKVVVDLGCGPGNLAKALGGRPRQLIGVDISEGALRSAQQWGYVPLLADVHDTPLASGCADLVVANATLHHTDDPARVLAEAARLVRPGGLLVTDEDPLQSAIRLRGMPRIAHALRHLVPVFRVRHHPTRRLRYAGWLEQIHRLRTELHHKFPGDGLAPDIFERVLGPMGFDVATYPHGHIAGAELLQDGRGTNTLWTRMAQKAAGLDPNASNFQLSVMCVARHKGEPTG
jgi:SAM-dependent methyltransferase